MAVTLGVNSGFVTDAPAADPDGSNSQISNAAWGAKDTSPATAAVITEIGWWCDNATEEINFEVGIYDHNSGDDNPEAVVGSLSQTNAKGTTAGWKVVAGLNILISEETIYWVAVQVDATSSGTQCNYGAAEGERIAWKPAPQTTLIDPWGSSNDYADYLNAIYAVWEAGAAPSPTNTAVNVGDTWKSITSVQVNVGDAWKAVTSMQVNIGDAWKAVTFV